MKGEKTMYNYSISFNGLLHDTKVLRARLTWWMKEAFLAEVTDFQVLRTWKDENGYKFADMFISFLSNEQLTRNALDDLLTECLTEASALTYNDIATGRWTARKE